MDIRRLQLFLAVAEHGGFTRAANALFLSQPALSQGIRELEQELGAELFHRLGRRVTLAPAGRALLGPARQVLRDLEAGRAAVASVVGLSAGRLDLVALPSLSADPLAPLVGAFRRRHPGVQVVIASPRDPEDLVRMVREGTCELGITDASTGSPGLVTVALETHELYAVLPPGTAPPTTDPMPLSDLEGIPFVSAPRGTSSRQALETALARAGMGAEVMVVSEQRDAILPLVLSGAGAAILPAAVAKTATARGALAVRLKPALTREVVLMHRPAPLSPAALVFAGLASSESAGDTGGP